MQMKKQWETEKAGMQAIQKKREAIRSNIEENWKMQKVNMI